MSIFSFENEDTFRKSLHLLATVEVELLQVGQLAKAFGQCGHAPPREVQLPQNAEEWMIERGLGEHFHLFVLV